MKSLSVSKLEVTGAKSENESEDESTSSASVVSIEVVLHVNGLTSVVHNAKERAECSVCESGCASEDQADVGTCEWVHVPVVGVVLDSFNSLNFAKHLFVSFLYIVKVSVSV